nr:hypothetical protein [Planococcus glaciei]
MDGLLEFVEDIKWLLYPFAFIFLFVSTTLYQFVKISLFALIGLCFHSDEKAQRRVSAFMAHDGSRGHCSDTFVVCLQFFRCSHVGNIRAWPTDNHLSAFCDKLLSEAASG